jgi:hypothetical protein
MSARYLQRMRDRLGSMAGLAVAGWLAGTAMSLASSYSNQQLELAGKLGAAVALSRICTGTVPTTAVVKALEASGLTQSDVLGDTPIHQRMRSEAAAILSDRHRKRDEGLPEAEIVKWACEGYRASFGPDGVLTSGPTN